MVSRRADTLLSVNTDMFGDSEFWLLRREQQENQDKEFYARLSELIHQSFPFDHKLIYTTIR